MDKTLQLSLLPILERINFLKEQVDALRPLEKDQEERIMQKFRLDWNYHSNAIEGNSLDYGETMAFLMHGVTAKGKPLKDHLDLKGHNQAIDFLYSVVKNNEDILEKDIRHLHKIILVEPYEIDTIDSLGRPAKKTIRIGEYKKEPNHVMTATGEIHYYTTPEETPSKMHDLMKWYNDGKENPLVHPVILASIFHHRITAIHPFDDGNGRMARLLMNLILMKFGFPPVVIKQDKGSRNQYYSVLS